MSKDALSPLLRLLGGLWNLKCAFIQGLVVSGCGVQRGLPTFLLLDDVLQLSKNADCEAGLEAPSDGTPLDLDLGLLMLTDHVYLEAQLVAEALVRILEKLSEDLGELQFHLQQIPD